MESMVSSDGGLKSCGKQYTCPDGSSVCQTRCYLFDQYSILVTDPDFITVSDLDTRFDDKRMKFGTCIADT